jgi:hypothetical protein
MRTDNKKALAFASGLEVGVHGNNYGTQIVAMGHQLPRRSLAAVTGLHR